MSDEKFTAYYRSREQQERAIAETATDPAAVAIHIDLAKRYSALVAGTARIERYVQ